MRSPSHVSASFFVASSLSLLGSVGAATDGPCLNGGPLSEQGTCRIPIGLIAMVTSSGLPELGNSVNAACTEIAVHEFNANQLWSSRADPTTDASKNPPIQLVPAVFDTQGSSTRGLNHTVTALLNGVKGIVGATRSSVTAPTAMLAGVARIPQISPSSTAPSLSNQEKYPYLLRTVASDATLAKGCAHVMKFFGWSRVGVIFVDGTYGLEFAATFQSAAVREGITVVAFEPFANTLGIQAAVEAVANAPERPRIVLAIVFDEHLPLTLRAAQDHGLIGPGYAWMFTDALSPVAWK